MKSIVSLFRLAWRYLWARPLAAVLNLALLTLGLASITLVMVVSDQIEAAFERDLAGIDAVVGAKGSPVQLILSGVFHIDVPPGNVPLAAIRELSQHPQVAQLIPLSMGDSFRGFRIVGTTADYPALYGAQLARGAWWSAPMQATLGASVAAEAGLAPGDRIIGTHGLSKSGHAHGDMPYAVVGVMAPCACVLDRLVLTATESVWQIHEKATITQEDERKALEDEREVTMALVRYRSPLAAVTFPRYVNASTEMQAASPAIEMTRLARMISVGVDVLRGFGLVLLVSAGLGVFMALWNAVRERRADLGLMRMLGAPPMRVAGLVMVEALCLGMLATLAGLLLGHAMAGGVGAMLEADRSLVVNAWHWSAREWLVPLAAGATAVFAAAIPAWSAFRADVAQVMRGN